MSDDTRCNEIGKKILLPISENGYAGNSLDAAIATAICIGVVNPQASGIGGDVFITYKSSKNGGETYTLDGRAMGPINAQPEDYLTYDDTTLGPQAIATFGTIKSFHLAHQKFGQTEWKNLFLDSIELCKNYTISASLYEAIEDKQRFIIPQRTNPDYDKIYNLDSIFYDFGLKRIKYEGEYVQDLALSETLRRVSENPASFYTDSVFRDEILADLNDLKKEGSSRADFLTKRDFDFYQPIQAIGLDETKTIFLENLDVNVLSPPNPSSGPLLQFMLGVWDLYHQDKNFNYQPTTLNYQRIVEIFKYTHGIRSNLGDYNIETYLKPLVENLTNPNYWREIKSQINDNYTSQDPLDYGANYTVPEDHGTSQIGVIFKNGGHVE